MPIDISLLLPELEKESKSYIDNITEYLESVNHLSSNSLNLEFNNKDKFHGAIVMSSLFAHARAEINVFAGDLNGSISGTSIYKTEMEKAIASGKRICFILEHVPSKDSSGIQNIKQLNLKFPGKIEMKLLKKGNTKMGEEGELFHFTVTDNNSFRFEVDKKNYKAFCNFDDKLISYKLQNSFANLKYMSEDFDINVL